MKKRTLQKEALTRGSSYKCLVRGCFQLEAKKKEKRTSPRFSLELVIGVSLGKYIDFCREGVLSAMYDHISWNSLSFKHSFGILASLFGDGKGYVPLSGESLTKHVT